VIDASTDDLDRVYHVRPTMRRPCAGLTAGGGAQFDLLLTQSESRTFNAPGTLPSKLSDGAGHRGCFVESGKRRRMTTIRVLFIKRTSSPSVPSFFRIASGIPIFQRHAAAPHFNCKNQLRADPIESTRTAHSANRCVNARVQVAQVEQLLKPQMRT